MQDRHAKDNAFNKYADSEYLYQGTDIQAIGSQIIQDLNNPEIIFAGALGRGEAHLDIKTPLREFQVDINKGKKVAGVYNTGGNHWIAFTITGQNVHYKDSLGSTGIKDFEDDIHAVLGKGVKFSPYDGKEQSNEDGVTCGLFALKNMQALVNSQLENKQRRPAFYEPVRETEGYYESLKKLRRNYAIKYAQQTLVQTRKVLADKVYRQEVCKLHDKEIEFIRNYLEGKVIDCEIRTLPDDPDHYCYYITFIEDESGHVSKIIEGLTGEKQKPERLKERKFALTFKPNEVLELKAPELFKNIQETAILKPIGVVVAQNQVEEEFVQALNLITEIDLSIVAALKKETHVDLTGKKLIIKPQPTIDATNPQLKENYRDLTADGLRKSLHGNLFQLGLLTLVAVRAERQNKPFYLVSEAKEFEKFDDLVIDYGDSVTFLQAKHSSAAKGDNYNSAHFLAKPDAEKNDASLAKYFDSWVRLRNGKYTKNEDNKSKATRYIFFTNRSISDAKDYLKDSSLDNDEFWFEDLPTKTYRFKSGKTRTQFIEAICAFSEEVKKESIADQIDFNAFEVELEEAYTYLKRRFKEFDNEPEKTINIYPRAANEKVRSLIKLSLIDKKVAKRVAGKDAVLLETLTNRKSQVSVSIDNPEAVLVPGIGVKVPEAEIQAINTFLDEFIIKVEQPNLVSLDQLLIKELHINANIAPLELFHALHNFMLNWFSQRHACLLKSDALHNFIEFETGDLSRFYLLGSTKTFEQESEAYPLDTKGLYIEGLQEFLENPKPQCPVAFVSNGGGIRQRVYQTIKKFKEEKDVKDAEWAYLTSGSTYLPELPKVLQGHSTQFVVVDCRSQNALIDDWFKIFEAAVVNHKKLVLLIEDSQKERLSHLLLQSFKVPIPSSSIPVFKVAPLTDRQLRQICQGRTNQVLNLGGKYLKLQQILESPQSGIYQLMKDLDSLCSILESLVEKEEAIVSGLPYDVYVANDLVEGIPQYYLRSFLETAQAGLFIIEGMKVKKLDDELRSWFNKQDETRYTSNDSITSNDIQYCLITDVHATPKNREKLIYILNPEESKPKGLQYIHVKLVDIGLFQVVVVENTANTDMPIPERYDFTTAPKVNFLQDSSSKARKGDFSIIAAHAGYGKSAFCRNQRFSWSRTGNDGSFWVIRLNLPHLQFNSDSPQLGDAFTASVTGEDWPLWKLKALELDMGRLGQVQLLLDGLDEIKDELMVQRLNHWLTKIPLQTSVLITTRPYAANKVSLPKTRLLDRYLTLKPYDDVQQKRYIKKYLKALFNEPAKDTSNPKAQPNNTELEIIVEGVYGALNTIVAKNVVRLLGIPLESYIFCEAMKPSIKQWWVKQAAELDTSTIFEGLANLSTAMLYQRFILAKFQLFLQKHMEMPLTTTLRNPHRVYSFAASYNDLLMVFAFRQAFGFSYDFVSKELRRVHYTKEMLEELPDTGLATVGDEAGEKFLKFNHETYQEYFAALFLLRGLLSSKDQSYEDVRHIIKEQCFNLKYRMVFVIAAQLSLSGDPIIPGWDQENNEQIKLFWRLLNEPVDLLGAAKSRLLRECVQGLLPQQRTDLRKVVKDEVWAIQLRDCIDQAYVVKDVEEEKANETELPVLVKGYDSNEVTVSSKFDKDTIKSQLSDKTQVLERTRYWLKKIKSVELAALFGEIIVASKLNHYWDIDGGFQAIAQLGDAFNAQLAKYFVERIESDPSWRANSALNAISILFRPDLNEDAKNACIDVIVCLINHFEHISSQQQLLKILRTFPKMILERLGAQLNAVLLDSLSDLANPAIDCENIFLKPLTFFRNILWVALHVEYALIIDHDNNTISLIADTRWNLTLVNNSIVSVFKKILKEGCTALEEESNKDKWLSGNKPWNALISEEIKEECEQAFYILFASKNKKFKKMFDLVKDDGSQLESLYRTLDKYHLITEDIVDLLTKELSTTKATDRGGYYGPWWSRQGGIAAVGYTGKYFTRTHADYLILRAGFWSDNKVEVIKALKQIKKTLASEQTHDEYYTLAVEAYNYTIKSIGIVDGLEEDLASLSLNKSITKDTDKSEGITDQVFDYFSKHTDQQRLVLACQKRTLEVSFTLIGVKEDEVIKFCTTNLGVKTEQVEAKVASAVVVKLKSAEQVNKFQALINQKTEKDKQVA